MKQSIKTSNLSGFFPESAVLAVSLLVLPEIPQYRIQSSSVHLGPSPGSPVFHLSYKNAITNYSIRQYHLALCGMQFLFVFLCFVFLINCFALFFSPCSSCKFSVCFTFLFCFLYPVVLCFSQFD